MAAPKINVLDTQLGDRIIDAAAITAQLSATPSPIVAGSLQLDTGTRTATAVSGSATLNKTSGVVTTESLSTAAAGIYSLTLSNSTLAGTEVVLASAGLGSATTGVPAVSSVQVSAGSVIVAVKNAHASAAFNGTLTVSFASFE